MRKMRRFKQQLSEEETVDILIRNTAGTLALLGDDGYPYSLPISYVYCNNKIYFHGAKSGHKIDAIENCDKASFSVIDQDKIIPEKYTSHFRSAIAFGKIRILKEENEILTAVDMLAEKYRPGHEAERNEEIRKEMPVLCMMELEIEYMTGKEAIELTRQRQEK